MPEAGPKTTPDGSAAPPTSSRTTVRCGYKVGARGGYLWWWHPGKSWIVRSAPATVRTKEDGQRGRWVSILDPPFELSSLLRELDHEALVEAGERTITSFPRHERPKRTPHGLIRRASVRQFFKEVPLNVQAALKVGFTSGSWALFRLLMSSAHARDLMQSEDGARIAWLLGNMHHCLRVADPLRRARRWAKLKRRDILGHLDFPSSASAVATLGRVAREDLSVWAIGDLRKVLLTPHLAERARHLPRITGAIIDLLGHEELVPYLSPALLTQLSLEEPGVARDRWRFSVELRETLYLLGQASMPVPTFLSREHVRRHHDRALAVVARARTETQSKRSFPDLPIALSPEELTFIRHLGHSAALSEEGIVMSHCLGRLPFHHELARRGDFHAFAVEQPERLTLALHRRNGRWEIYDFRGPGNVMPSQGASIRTASSILDRFRAVDARSKERRERSLRSGSVEEIPF